jgi:AcrR family transcriptional regulator
MTAAAGRPLRADARRNRARLLEAAEVVVAAKGVSASTEEVARAAGVGVGTLFRHFPTKEALLEAVYRGRLQWMADAAREQADADDPGEAFFSLLTDAVGHSGTKIAISDALTRAGVDLRTASAEESRALAEGLTALLVRAQQAGAVRSDVELPELMAVLVGASHAARHATDGDRRARVVTLVLDGLRPPRSRPCGTRQRRP